MKRLIALLLCLAVLPAWAGKLVLGSKNFTEQHLLSELTRQTLQAHGFQVEVRTDLATTLMRQALENRQLDLVWDYTGTALIVYHHRDDDARLPPEQAHALARQLDAGKKLVWLNPAPLNNTYALAMQRSRAEAEGIRTLSDLARRLNAQSAEGQPWQLGFDVEFAGRPDGLKPMQKVYGFELSRPQIRQMDSGLVYNAVRDGFVAAGLVYQTDGRIQGFDLQVLADDKGYFPGYAATPVVRKEVLDANPDLAPLLNRLAALLDNETMSALNAQVDIAHRAPATVAAEFLKTNHLLEGGR